VKIGLWNGILRRAGFRFFDAGVYSSTLNGMQMKPVVAFASLEAGAHARAGVII